ncbi:MAG: hypothetical protein ACTSU5_00910, partial [Promethearchaeota archaeon]
IIPQEIAPPSEPAPSGEWVTPVEIEGPGPDLETEPASALEPGIDYSGIQDLLIKLSSGPEQSPMVRAPKRIFPTGIDTGTSVQDYLYLVGKISPRSIAVPTEDIIGEVSRFEGLTERQREVVAGFLEGKEKIFQRRFLVVLQYLSLGLAFRRQKY